MSWFRLKLIMWLWPRRGSTSSCANRWTRRAQCGAYEVELRIRDTSKPDGYSREEIVEMKRELREHAIRQGLEEVWIEAPGTLLERNRIIEMVKQRAKAMSKMGGPHAREAIALGELVMMLERGLTYE